MYIKKYICTTYVKYHSTSLSSPPVIPHLMRDPSPPVIPHLMRDPFSLDSRLRGNDGRGAGMTHPLSSSTDCPGVILNRKRSASDWGSIRTGFPFSREWRAERE